MDNMMVDALVRVLLIVAGAVVAIWLIKRGGETD